MTAGFIGVAASIVLTATLMRPAEAKCPPIDNPAGYQNMLNAGARQPGGHFFDIPARTNCPAHKGFCVTDPTVKSSAGAAGSADYPLCKDVEK